MPIIFKNAQWEVSTTFLGCRRYEYWIAAKRLIHEWPHHSWHQQVGVKGWADIDLFNPAFRVAVYVFHRGKFKERMLRQMEDRGREKFARMVLDRDEAASGKYGMLLEAKDLAEIGERVEHRMAANPSWKLIRRLFEMQNQG